MTTSIDRLKPVLLLQISRKEEAYQVELTDRLGGTITRKTLNLGENSPLFSNQPRAGTMKWQKSAFPRPFPSRPKIAANYYFIVNFNLFYFICIILLLSLWILVIFLFLFIYLYLLL